MQLLQSRYKIGLSLSLSLSLSHYIYIYIRGRERERYVAFYMLYLIKHILILLTPT